jgi:hypothetical protein
MAAMSPQGITAGVLTLLALAPLGAATDVAGVISTATWTQAGSPYRVTANAQVPAGATLTIEAGAEVAFAPDVNLVVRGELRIEGTAELHVRFVGLDDDDEWGGVVIDGASAFVAHLELTGASTARSGGTSYLAAWNGVDGAEVEITSSWFHDFPGPVIESNGGSSLVVRDTVIERSRGGIHSANGYALVEDVIIRDVFEYSDSIDYDGDSVPQSVIRRTLIDGNRDDDGIDLASANALIEDVVIRRVLNGKAISLDGVSTPVFRRVLVYDSMLALVIKDSCTPRFENCTVARCQTAVSSYQKTSGRGGGHGTAENLIIWGNEESVSLDELSTFTLTHSIVAGGYAGDGNFDADPLFIDFAGGDFRLDPTSPAVGAGADGATLGALPVAEPRADFVRGETNGDGSVDLSDAVKVLLVLFAGVGPPTCADAMDADDTGEIDLTDAVVLLAYLFASGPPPAAPFPDPGPDPTDGDPHGCF